MAQESIIMGFKAASYYGGTKLTGNIADAAVSGVDAASEFSFTTGTTTRWYLFENIMDLTINAEADNVETTTRAEAAKGWKSQAFTANSGSITFDMRWHTAPNTLGETATPAYTAFKVMKDAWLNRTQIAMLFLDQPYTVKNAQGLVANFFVSFNVQQPVGDVQKCSVNLTVGSYPEWVYSTGTVLAATEQTP